MQEPQISTRFGTVTPQSVEIPLAGRRDRTEAIALRHITAVTYEIDRQRTVGVFVAAVGFIAVVIGVITPSLPAVGFGLIAIAFAVIMSLDRPRITIRTADGRARVERGRIGSTDEAEQFVTTLRARLFDLPPA